MHRQECAHACSSVNTHTHTQRRTRAPSMLHKHDQNALFTDLSVTTTIFQAIDIKNVEFFDETMDDIRVASFNVHGWRDTHHKPSVDGVIKAIELLNPDVLVLNEVLEPFFPSSMTEVGGV